MAIKLAMALTLISSCAPSPDKREFKNTKPAFAPKTQDVKLTIPEKLTWEIPEGQFSSSALMEFSSDLYDLGSEEVAESKNASALKAKAAEALNALQGHPQALLKIPLKDSPFVAAAAGSTIGTATDKIQGLLQMLEAQEKRLLTYLVQNPLEIPGDISSLQMLATLGAHLERLKLFLMAPETHPIVRAEMLDEIKKQSAGRLSSASEQLGALENSKTLGGVLAAVDGLTEEFSVSLDAPARKNYQFGLKLDNKIANTKTAEDLLEISVLVWEFYTPSERAQLIKPFSPELYDFMMGQDKAGLDCLARRSDCDLITYIQKFSVASEIESQGVEKVRQKLQNAARSAGLSIVRRNVRSALLNLPKSLIEERVKKKFSDKKKILSQVIPGYRDLVASIVKNWSKKELAGLAELPSFEASGIRLKNLKAGANPKVIVEPVLSGATTSGSREWSAGFRTSVQKIESLGSLETPEAQTELKLEYLNLINRLFVTGGFRDDKKQVQNSLMMNLTAQNPEVELANVTETSQTGRGLPSFLAIPDKVHLSPLNAADTEIRNQSENPGTPAPQLLGLRKATADLKASAQNQARLLSALTRVMKTLKDWKESSFDRSVGLYNVTDYLPEAFKVGGFESKLFPKSDLFALSIANLGTILKNLKHPSSPLFVVNTVDDHSFDRQKLSQASDKKVSTVSMAAYVDLELKREAQGDSSNRSGEDASSLIRSNFVEAEAMARWILAFAEFIEASSDLEQSKSELLKSEIPNLMSARGELKSLILAMANFLAHKMLDPEGKVHSQYSISAKSHVPDQKILLKNQILVMAALHRANEILGTQVYMTPAQEILNFINSRMYDNSKGFYKAELSAVSSSPQWNEMPEYLLHLRRVAKQLTGFSQAQLMELTNRWIQEILKVEWDYAK